MCRTSLRENNFASVAPTRQSKLRLESFHHSFCAIKVWIHEYCWSTLRAKVTSGRRFSA